MTPITPPDEDRAVCGKCDQEIALLGDHWTDPDGCTNCMADTSAVYAPHLPAADPDPFPLHGGVSDPYYSSEGEL